MTAISGILQPRQVVERWADIEPLLARAVDNSLGESQVADVLEAVKDGKAFVAILMETNGLIVFACACEVIVYPRMRALHITLMAGKDIRRYGEHFKVIEEAARDLDCSRIQALCLPGAARLFQSKAGFHPLYQMIGKQVTP